MENPEMFYGNIKKIESGFRLELDKEGDDRTAFMKFYTDSAAIVTFEFPKAGNRVLFEAVDTLREIDNIFKNGHIKEVEKGVFQIYSPLASGAYTLPGKIWTAAELLDHVFKIMDYYKEHEKPDDDILSRFEPNAIRNRLEDVENLVRQAKCLKDFKMNFGKIYCDIMYLYEYDFNLGDDRYGWEAFKKFFDEKIAEKLKELKDVCQSIVILREEKK